MRPLRDALLLLSRSGAVKRTITTLPVSAAVVRSYVPGETAEEALDAAAALAADGIDVTLDHLGEDTTDLAQAEATVEAYLDLLRQIAARGLAGRAEVSVKLTAIGLALDEEAVPGGGRKIALEHARAICRAARNAGTTVTIDMEDHTTTDATLAVVRELRKDFPETGAVLQSYLRRTEDDCRELAYEGSRVRLCKGAYDEPGEVAFTDPDEVDRAYVRCLKLLLASGTAHGHSYPMIATHDPRLVEIASALASRYGRPQGTYEFQMLYGIRPAEQRRLAAAGESVRVYIPYGTEWYGYLMRRLAERPRNLSFFLTSLVKKS
ncbi:proline dehydrogenase family protein [Nocardioides sp. TF02-7]|uniref:proline dehydrogenase family protein n=1 Tax=Nocardioides sp. TF02-7 TaxID=2917724 RepID=UPI001F052A40|nr:proline dehydrogenase family protein [Nocardioides sp. TF02-7]UMG93872.1 proline dehydrogenase family protein [Nocardioides sp. TF02-7]